MLIMSWNVAGLSTTVNRIHESYSPFSQKKAPASAALHAYIQRHGADILCLQEHKIPLSQLSDRSEPCGCSTVEGYESFWSCCVDKSKQGFNGVVVTYAKKGTVLRANASPLGSPDLDDQRFRLAVTVDNRRVYLGKHESSPEWCSYGFDFDDSHYVDPETNEECIALEANVVRLGVLTELMSKIAGVEWDDATQRQIAGTDAGIRRIKPPTQWLQCMMEQDGMVDTFRFFLSHSTI
jgi:exonuclease III